jgi:hypothetical protein
MNTKPLFYLGCFLAVSVAAPTIDAGPHHRGGSNRGASRPARIGGGGGRTFSGNRIAHWNGQRWNGQHLAGNRRWNGQNWSGKQWKGSHWNGQHWNNHWGNNWNWHHHHHHNNSFVFLDFGFPFWGWWGYPSYYSYYPYGYSSYGCYPYGYYGSGYGSGYYGSGYYGSYGYNYGNGYGYDNGYSNHYDAKVAELQRRLANAGYYRGEIDGIFGSRTQYALKAYRHDHPNGNESGAYNSHNYPNLRDHPYSPPPTTTEPTE